MISLRYFWEKWIAFGAWLGGFISTALLFVFYFTVFALFAVPYILFGRNTWKTSRSKSGWLKRDSDITNIADFESE